MSALLIPLSLQTHHNFRNISSFCKKKNWIFSSENPLIPLVRKMSAMNKPLTTNCGYLLWRRALAVGGQGGRGPSDFKRGTNIVNKGLKVLFFGLFSYFRSFFPLPPPPPPEEAKEYYYSVFFANFRSFFTLSLEIFLPTPLLAVGLFSHTFFRHVRHFALFFIWTHIIYSDLKYVFFEVIFY